MVITRIHFTSPAETDFWKVGDRVSTGEIIVAIDRVQGEITTVPATRWLRVRFWLRSCWARARWWLCCSYADLRIRCIRWLHLVMPIRLVFWHIDRLDEDTVRELAELDGDTFR